VQMLHNCYTTVGTSNIVGDYVTTRTYASTSQRPPPNHA